MLGIYKCGRHCASWHPTYAHWPDHDDSMQTQFSAREASAGYLSFATDVCGGCHDCNLASIPIETVDTDPSASMGFSSYSAVFWIHTAFHVCLRAVRSSSQAGIDSSAPALEHRAQASPRPWHWAADSGSAERQPSNGMAADRHTGSEAAIQALPGLTAPSGLRTLGGGGTRAAKHLRPHLTCNSGGVELYPCGFYTAIEAERDARHLRQGIENWSAGERIDFVNLQQR